MYNTQVRDTLPLYVQCSPRHGMNCLTLVVALFLEYRFLQPQALPSTGLQSQGSHCSHSYAEKNTQKGS